MSSSCVTSLSFSVFFLSLRLSRFNKASCRVWLSWEMQQSVAGAEAGSGLVVRRGCKLGGEHFRPFSPCNTPRSLERWQPAVRSLPYVFFPFTPSSTSFPSYFSRSVPPRLRPSPSPPSRFPPTHLLFFLFLLCFLLSSFPCSLLWKADSHFGGMTLSRRPLSGTIQV